VTKGRAAIEAAEAAGAKDSKIAGGTIRTLNVYLDGGVAYETGTYAFDVVLPGKPARVATGRYFEVWEKQPDGAWLIKVDCGYPDKYKR
jgi:ketosteroid isomerase-like protein